MSTPDAPAPRANNGDPNAVARRRRLRVVFRLAALLALLLVLELGARAYWAQKGVPFLTTPSDLRLRFYKELKEVDRESLARDDDALDVLLLGGSVLHPAFGDIGSRLEQRLSDATSKRVRVHNLAAPGHTTRDSYFKYRALRDEDFDLVILYQGINETRANNCPDEMFREDYAHYAWYRLVNVAEDGAESRWFALPYTVYYAYQRTIERLKLSKFVPANVPRPASTQYGLDVKSGPSVKGNVTRMVEIAEAEGEPFLLVTFATYVAPGYSRAAYVAGELDYTARDGARLELWGRADGVRDALEIHNAMVREVASERSVPIVDAARTMPGEGRLFADVCHMSPAGCEQFVELLVPEAARLLDARE